MHGQEDRWILDEGVLRLRAGRAIGRRLWNIHQDGDPYEAMRGRDQLHLAAQHGSGRGGLVPRCAALVAKLRAEQLLEVFVGGRQAGQGVAVEQSGTVAAGDLGEVVAQDGWSAAAGGRFLAQALGDRGCDLPPCRV